ncbi:MAG TPA: hypothetical protein VG099_24675 [Gemmataceae bacterium]|jgi:hypothetical protein|nr:hypothetical protein [Gemmataceae bacterium]
MAQPSVTGPIYIYVSSNGQPTTPLYLGVFETGPFLDVTPSFTPVNSDVAAAKPHDWIYGGKDGACIGDMTVFNWPQLEAIMSRPLNATAGAGLLPVGFGYDPPGARGSLMVTEGFNWTLWTQFPYFAKAAWGGWMPGGFRWPGTFLMGPDRFQLGTRPNKIGLAFFMQAIQDRLGGWVLCDNNMQGIPSTPPIGLAGV